MFERFLNHLAKLVDAIHILSSTNISQSKWKVANDLLLSFVDEFEVLYGKKNMVYNIHQLRHLADCVKKNGPLFAYSNYAMEDYIGHLVSFVKGTTDVATQVCSRYLLEKKLFVHLQSSPIAIEFYNSIESKLTFSITRKVNGSLVIGKAKVDSNLNEEELSFIKNTLEICDGEQIQEYNAVLLNCRVYYETFANNNKKRTDDSFISNVHTKSFAIIRSIFTMKDELYFLVVQNFEKIENAACRNIIFLKETNSFRKKIVRPESIGQKCAVVKFKDTLAVSHFPNLHERN